MRTIEIAILKFDELDPPAKQRAKDAYAEANGYHGAEDYLASLKALAEHFGGKLTTYDIDFFGGTRSSADFDMPEMSGAEIRRRLKTLGSYNRRTGKGLGDCKLTGYCADEDAIDGFRIAFRQGERDLAALMEAAYDTWLEHAQADCAGFFEDDQFSEHCDANGYEFVASGKRAPK